MNKLKIIGITNIILGILNIGKYLHYASYYNIHLYENLIVGICIIMIGRYCYKSS